MKPLKKYTYLIIVLSIMSASIYLIQYFLFHRADEAAFLLLEDLAFIPIQAIVVTLLLDKLINMIEKQNKLKKINVIISAFFSVTGVRILFALADQNENHEGFCGVVENASKPRRHRSTIKKIFTEYDYKINPTPESLEKLGVVITESKADLITMLQNDNLLEHDSFTDMLWAVFHVADELSSRDIHALSITDSEHIANDIKRAYSMMIVEWMGYVRYLKSEYPYLYMMAAKKNPFCKDEIVDKLK